jgi:hypothetical protein
MKQEIMKKIILIALTICIANSCKKSDKIDIEETQVQSPQSHLTTAQSYMPLSVGNYWIYERYAMDTNNVIIESGVIDSVYIEKDTIINNAIYFKLVSKNMINTNGLSNYLANYTQYFNFSANYLEDPLGKKYFSDQDFTTLFYSYNDSFYSTLEQMKDQNITVTTPLGSFVTHHCKKEVVYNSGVPNALKVRYSGKRYSNNVGVVIERLPFFYC